MRKIAFAGGGEPRQHLQPANTAKPPGYPRDSQPDPYGHKAMRKRPHPPMGKKGNGNH